MILLDTHIWIWLVTQSPSLSVRQRTIIRQFESGGLGVSVISCWETGKLVEKGRLTLQHPLAHWISQALAYPSVALLPLTPEIAVESTQLPPPFHSDPADQIIVATARVRGIPLLTADAKILSYPHVGLLT